MSSVLSIFANEDYIFYMGLAPAAAIVGLATLHITDVENYFVPYNSPNEKRNLLLVRGAYITTLFWSYITYVFSLDHIVSKYF